MGVNDWWSHNVTGQMTADDYAKLPQVNAIDPKNYEIQGMGAYQDALRGMGNEYQQMGQQGSNAFGQLSQGINSLQGQMPGAPNLQGMGAQSLDQQQALQNYLQSVAMGQAPSAADVMLQRGQQMAAKNLQSGIVSQSGMNPALAMRQLYGAQASNSAQLAGQAAQQKLGEQQSFGAMAQQGGQNLLAQKTNLAQMDFSNQMGQNDAKLKNYQAQVAATQQQFQIQQQALAGRQGVANGIFNANRAQTGYNVQQGQDRQSYEMFQQARAQQQQQDQLRSQTSLTRSLINGGLTAGGMAIGSMFGPAGTMIGGSLGGSLAGGITGGGGGGGMDPNMLMALSRRSQPQQPQQPFTFDNGMTGQDANNANQMGTQGYVGQAGLPGGVPAWMR